MRKKRRLNNVPLFFLLPALLLLLATSIGPFLYGVGISLFHFRFTAGSETVEFVGLRNYAYEILHDPVFPTAFWNSIKWVLLVDAGCLIIGLFMAVRLNRDFRGRAVARVAAWLPWATPLVAVAVIWQIIYQPTFGLLNSVLGVFGIEGQRWLSDPSMALYAVAIAQIWRWVPFFTITLLAGLQAIPEELYEAGKVDGTSPWQSFRHITLPLLQSTASLTLLVGTIWAFKTFTLVYALTGGGPANSSQVLSTWGYELAFRFGYLDRGAVVGTVTALILLVFGTFWVRSEAGGFRNGD